MENLCFWKQLWKITTFDKCEDNVKIILSNKVTTQLQHGVLYHKKYNKDSFNKFKAEKSLDNKIIGILQDIAVLLDLDGSQSWDLLQHYFVSQGHEKAEINATNLSNIDVRASHILPKIFAFYYTERLYMLKLLKYALESCHGTHHNKNVFQNLIDKIGLDELKSSCIKQLEHLLKLSPVNRKDNGEHVIPEMQSLWLTHNLLEQLEILQTLVMAVNSISMTEIEFRQFFSLCRWNEFGRNQNKSSTFDNRNNNHVNKIIYSQIAIIMLVMDARTINDTSCWIQHTKDVIESELSKIDPNIEYSAILLCWMILSLQSEKHERDFENHFQQFGFKALHLRVFKFFLEMIRNPMFSDESACSRIVRLRVFDILSFMCGKFDGDGLISNQPYVMELCGELLSRENVADKFWCDLEGDDDCGVTSLWNSALEYFPYNFKAVSLIASGLACSGSSSVQKLKCQLESMPIYTEPFQPHKVDIKICSSVSDVVVMRNYQPDGIKNYAIKAGSGAAITERKEGTLIHFRTPISYWTLLQHYAQTLLLRKTHNIDESIYLIERITDGAKVLKNILRSEMDARSTLSKSLICCSEILVDVFLTLTRLEKPPFDLIVNSMDICSLLAAIYPMEIHARITSTNLFPRIMNKNLTHVEYSDGASFSSCTLGAYLLNYEIPNGSYKFLNAYINMLCEFYEACNNKEKIIMDILLPGLMMILREIFPNLCQWRYSTTEERRKLTANCIKYVSLVIQLDTNEENVENVLQKTCVYNLLYMENAVELLKIITVGEDQLEKVLMQETNWTSGPGGDYLKNMQRTMGLFMHILRLKYLVTSEENMTPLEQLIFAQTNQHDMLKLVPQLIGYLNNVMNEHIPILALKLLMKFAKEMDMSLFSCLNMTPDQVRVMFVKRLEDPLETAALKIAILEFVTSCVEKQPALIEALFGIQYVTKSKKMKLEGSNVTTTDRNMLTFLEDYLKSLNENNHGLFHPLLASVMGLFHAVWKNNLQVLVKDLRDSVKFWQHITSPLFAELVPDLRSYSQVFNLVGIELFTSRTKVDADLKKQLEKFFEDKYLDKCIEHIFSLKDRNESNVCIDLVPAWLSLLTSWKDFTMIICKCPPFTFTDSQKKKLAGPCLDALLTHIKNFDDVRLVVLLAELYVIMLNSWGDDCMEEKSQVAKNIGEILKHTVIYYDELHPRAKRAILSIGITALNKLDYHLKSNSTAAKNVIESVTFINSLELDNLYQELNEKTIELTKDRNGYDMNKNIPPIVLSLAMLEECLDIYDDMFSDLIAWLHSTKFVSKILACLHKCINIRAYFMTTLRALRCLTACARRQFSSDLLSIDIDQYIFLQLLPPKNIVLRNSTNSKAWKAIEWWQVYSYGIDFIATMLMSEGQLFLHDAITFVGVHLDSLVETILLPRDYIDMEVLNMCASALSLIQQIARYESRWRIENVHSLTVIMRATSACLHHCVSLLIRCRMIEQQVEQSDKPEDQPASTPSTKVALTLNRLLDIIHAASLCLISFSPDILSLLTDPSLDVEKWQPIMELNFGPPKIMHDELPQLNFGTFMAAIAILTRSLNHSYHGEDMNVSRSPRGGGRRRSCSCSSPGDTRKPCGHSPADPRFTSSSPNDARRLSRSESTGSVTSAANCFTTGWLAAFDRHTTSNTLQLLLTLLASQALLTIRDRRVSNRDKQLVRRELATEMTSYHDFVKKRIVSLNLTRNVLVRNKLGIRPLPQSEEEARLLSLVREESNCDESMGDALTPPPPPPRRAQDSMREFLLRKRHLDKAKTLPKTFEGFSVLPVSHSTPAPSDKKSTKKRVSWAETEATSDCTDVDLDSSHQQMCATATDVEINGEEDYLHFMSNVFLYICQTEL